MTQEEASYGTGLCDKCYNVFCTQYVKNTAGEVHLYRWGPLYDHVNEANRAQPSLWDVPVSTNDDRIRQFVSRVKEEFWQPWKNHAGYAQGLGLYCATDAASTREFGGSGEWCLIQFRMPAGTPYLDLTLMPETWCRCAHFPYPCISRAFLLPALSFCNNCNMYCRFSDSAFQEKKIKLFQAAGIQALLYPYGTSQFRKMQSRRKCAFVLVDDRAINFGAATVFTQLQPPDEPWGVYQNRLLIQEMFKEAGKSNLPWPHLRDHVPAQDMTEWAVDNLFN